MKTATTHLTIAASPYGSRVPRLTVVFGRGVPYRLTNAALHARAAEGGDAEAQRRLALLRKEVP